MKNFIPYYFSEKPKIAMRIVCVVAFLLFVFGNKANALVLSDSFVVKNVVNSKQYSSESRGLSYRQKTAVCENILSERISLTTKACCGQKKSCCLYKQAFIVISLNKSNSIYYCTTMCSDSSALYNKAYSAFYNSPNYLPTTLKIQLS